MARGIIALFSAFALPGSAPNRVGTTRCRRSKPLSLHGGIRRTQEYSHVIMIAKARGKLPLEPTRSGQ